MSEKYCEILDWNYELNQKSFTSECSFTKSLLYKSNGYILEFKKNMINVEFLEVKWK